MESSSSSSTPLTERWLQSLTSRGWCFNTVSLDQVRAIITIHSAINGDSFSVNSLESELCNVDLRSIGGKSLPDPSLLRKASQFLLPPKVLQAIFFPLLLLNYFHPSRVYSRILSKVRNNCQFIPILVNLV